MKASDPRLKKVIRDLDDRNRRIRAKEYNHRRHEDAESILHEVNEHHKKNKIWR